MESKNKSNLLEYCLTINKPDTNISNYHHLFYL